MKKKIFSFPSLAFFLLSILNFRTNKGMGLVWFCIAMSLINQSKKNNDEDGSELTTYLQTLKVPFRLVPSIFSDMISLCYLGMVEKGRKYGES